MAIVFSHGGSNTASASTSVVVTVTVNAGDTVVVVSSATTLVAVSSVADSGGSTYTKRGLTGDNGVVLQTEIWSTEANGAKASTTVTINYGSAVLVAASVATYTGVDDLGKTATPASGSSSAPSVAITTQDSNNFVVAGMGITTIAAGSNTWSATTGNLRTNQAASTLVPGAAIMDNTAAGVGSVTCTAALSQSTTWNALALELRSVEAAIAIKNFSFLPGFGGGR